MSQETQDDRMETNDDDRAKIIINALLKCATCQQFPASPIHSCTKGHIVCGICHPTVWKCPTCRDGTTGQQARLSHNGLVDSILKADRVEVSCRNFLHGCTQSVSPSAMKRHLERFCDFRPIKCTESGECNSDFFPPNAPKALFQHWIKIHKLEKIIPVLIGGPGFNASFSSSSARNGQSDPEVVFVAEPLGIVVRSCGLKKQQLVDNKLQCEFGWPSKYFYMDGQTFLLHTESDGSLVHSWITLLGEEFVARKYQFTATVTEFFNLKGNPPSEGAVFNRHLSFHNIPIHCLQYCALEKVDALGHTAAVGFNNLKMLQQERPNDPKFILEFSVRFDISSVPDPEPFKVKVEMESVDSDEA